VRVLYHSQVASRANAPTGQLFLLGADPGGKGEGNADGNFGWALVAYKPGSSPPSGPPPSGPPPSGLVAVHSGVAQNARQALWGALCAAGAGRIVAIGVDGPLGYDADHDRAIDGHIRARLKPLGASPGSPGTTNSLRGACLVQAVAFALLAQQTLGENLLITESYPLAVRHLSSPPLHAMCATCPAYSASCHACDATLAAASAWACAENNAGSPLSGWQNLHCLPSSGRFLRPEFMIVPGHEYWLPA